MLQLQSLLDAVEHTFCPLLRSLVQTSDILYLLALQRVGDRFGQTDLVLQYHALVDTGRDCVLILSAQHMTNQFKLSFCYGH